MASLGEKYFDTTMDKILHVSEQEDHIDQK